MTRISSSPLIVGTIGGGLDRCAHLRDNPHLLDQDAYVVLTSGEQLLCDEAAGVVYSPITPLLTALKSLDDTEPRFVFLGCCKGRRIFAVDIAGDDNFRSELTQRLLEYPVIGCHSRAPVVSFCNFRDVFSAMSDVDMICASTAKALFSWHKTQRFCGGCGQPSQLEQWGWKMTCPECGMQVFPRTDVAVIMQVQYQGKVLLGRGYGFPEGVYSFLSGFLEPGETIEEAVQRETIEEAGIIVGSVGYTASQPWPFPMTLMVGCWAQALSGDITVDTSELEDARWFSYQEINQLMQGQLDGKKPPREGTIARFMLEKWLQDSENGN